MNKFMNGLKEQTNFTLTENNALTHKSTLNACLDFFAMGGAMRERSDNDVLNMFMKAFREDEVIALKLLFYFRDIRGGQGERRLFRVIIKHLAKNSTVTMKRNLKHIPEFGRWDDLYEFVGTPLQADALDFMKDQFVLDLQCKTPSLLGKWLKSENASSQETKILGAITRKHFGLSSKQYRRALSELRARINVLERLMSANKWDEIEFDKIPSKAGLIYRNAFARRDLIAKKYEAFAMDTETKVNAKALYPYEIVEKVLDSMGWYGSSFTGSDVERAMLNKYWANLPDFFGGKEMNGIAVVDTSGSMSGDPINVAISLGLYMAERSGGPFANHYISFASRPQLIETSGVDFVDKVERIYRTNLIDNTNIEATFDLILDTAIRTGASQDDLPQNIFVISDMEFDSAARAGYRSDGPSFNKRNADTLLEGIAKKFAAHGYQLPHMIFWNVNARQDNIPMLGVGRISYVSGCSPVIFESILKMKTGYDLMMEVVNKERYSLIK